MMMNKVIISGGGTGGHIFPAIAIADEIKARNPEVEILFVGAIGKMEMDRVPQAGYKIIGLPIAGFQRKFTWSNFLLPLKIIKSLRIASRIIKDFKPNIVIGVGGYASGPTLRAAISKKIPTLIQEQNSHPGKTNIILGKNVTKICAAYEGLDKFFPKEKIVITGNPVRNIFTHIDSKRSEAQSFFNLKADKKTLLVVGGSLGARTLNDCIENNLEEIKNNDYQVIWQSGKFYFNHLKEKLEGKLGDEIKLNEFIANMDLAYAAADIIISRAGAISISELCLLGKPTILIPSPNVAEDHQTKNALALVRRDAAILLKDSEASKNFIAEIQKIFKNESLKNSLSANIRNMALPNATKDIVDEIIKIAKV
jgi:UDP-N-acetylglucosamine--N-acetylmuramyl-(pentapeptide) pyrophosphoryl-undecaprenol N-acetylglucosamine transferase